MLCEGFLARVERTQADRCRAGEQAFQRSLVFFRGSAERGHAVLCLGIGNLLQVRLVPLPSEHCAHALEDEVVPQNAAEYGCVFRRIESTGRLGFVLCLVRGQRVLELLAVL